jgi:hypothetical protein
MELILVRIGPVQEIAAERGTLDTFIDILRSKDGEVPRASPELLAAARLTDWPLVYDDQIPPGYVHCRPTTGAPPPPTPEQLAEWVDWFTERTAHAAAVATVEQELLTGNGTGKPLGIFAWLPREPTPAERALEILAPKLRWCPLYKPR